MENPPTTPPPAKPTLDGRFVVIALVILCLLVAGYATWQIKLRLTIPKAQEIPGPNGLTKSQEAELAKIQEGFAQTVRQGLPQDRVIAATQDLLERAPNSSDARLLLGQAYLKANKPDLAYKELNLALKLEPDLLEARLLVGTLALGMNKPDEADAHYQHAFKIAPTNERARLHMAQNALSRGDIQQGLDLAKATADTNPRSHQAQAVLSEALLKKGDLPPALEAITLAIELAPTKDRDQTVVYIRKQATILRAMNLPQDALACLRKLTPEERADPGALEESAITLEQMGQTDLAALLCGEMANNTPGNPKYAAIATKWWIKAGDLEQAKKQLHALETAQPGSPIAKQLAAQLQEAQNKK